MKTLRLGSDYGGWAIPEGLLTETSIVYSAGAGEDISFDVEVCNKYGCEVLIFDPTPRALTHFEKRFEYYKIGNPSLLRFYEFGLAKETYKYRPFYLPKNKDHVSCSIEKISGECINATFYSLADYMREFNHRRIDLLKMDIEGAEYEVIDSILENNIDIQCICVEFHNSKRLIDGYTIIAEDGKDVTFLKI
jgi:FkbM family methyltransferase